VFKVGVNVAGLDRVIARLNRPAVLNTTSGPLRDGLVAAGAIYLGSMRERYVRAARGDGTWLPLAPSTIAGRRKGKGSGGKVEILRDTGILLNSLSLGANGNVQQMIDRGIEVGTVIRYAKHHQYGGTTPGRPPQRKILVAPDQPTRERMRAPIQRAVAKIAAEAAKK
jgi:phage gpG-like protein